MSSWWKAGLAGMMIAGAGVAATAVAVAQMSPEQQSMHKQMMQSGQGMQGHGEMMQGMHGQMQGHGPTADGATGKGDLMSRPAAAIPTAPGNDAFGAIQEVVRILEADPATDWSKVNITALREHLIDMNEVTLHAVTDERVMDNGIEITVTGEGRTLAAIKRMVPAHIAELARNGWNAKTEDLPNGVKLIVTSPEPAERTKLKALGFMGIMVQGAHHQLHHLAMAKGAFVH